MTKFALVHFNRLDCELARYPVVQEDNGSPLMLATIAQSADLREGLSVMEPGDRLEFVEIEEAEDINRRLAAHAYRYAELHYSDKGARFDVIVECMTNGEIARELGEQGITDKAGAIAWAKRRAGLHHEQELNQAVNGPESCVGSPLYDPTKAY
jgi:hypothetical protein